MRKQRMVDSIGLTHLPRLPPRRALGSRYRLALPPDDLSGVLQRAGMLPCACRELTLAGCTTERTDPTNPPMQAIYGASRYS